MTKKEIQDRAKAEVREVLNIDALGTRIDSFTWIITAKDGSQVKVTLTACKDPINLDDAIAELGLKEEERARKEAEREAKKLAKEVK